ncbi:MAG: alkaline phosphatase [Planctomycetota bacterium]|nr:alkaline phosphatase [Planctomycetota bacterium]
MVRTVRLARALAVWAVLVLVMATASWAEAPRNVILLIGDGMGFEQVKAASLYATDKQGGLAFEKYYRAEMTTHSLNSFRKRNHATDSAAAAAAIATGYKTKNGYLALLPDGRELATVPEVFAKAGKQTGLVTTVPMTHATPAAFGSHVKSRNDTKKIAAEYFTQTRPNVMFGAYVQKGAGVTGKKAAAAGYEVVKTRDEMKALAARLTGAARSTPVHVSGQFAPEQMPWEYTGPIDDLIATDGYEPGMEDDDDDENKDDGADPREDVTFETAPHLSEMSAAALALLDGPKGFFLLIEGGSIDKAGHKNQIERSVFETLEFEKTFRTVMAWAADRKDTLVIVTADHECGAMWVTMSRGKEKFPKVVWGRRDHSGLNVPVYAWGPGADSITGIIDNTALYAVMTGEPPAPLPPPPPPKKTTSEFREPAAAKD